MLAQTRLDNLQQSFPQLVLAGFVSLPFPPNAGQVFENPPAYKGRIFPQNAQNEGISRDLLIRTGIGMETILVSQKRMPEQTLQVRHHILINILLHRSHLAPLLRQLLRKEAIRLEVIKNGLHASNDDLRLQSNNNLDSRPLLLLLKMIQLQEITSPIQKLQITNPPKPQLLISQKQINKLRSPTILSHIQIDLNNTIHILFVLLINQHILLVILPYIISHLLPSLQQLLYSTIDMLYGTFIGGRFGVGQMKFCDYISQHLFFLGYIMKNCRVQMNKTSPIGLKKEYCKMKKYNLLTMFEDYCKRSELITINPSTPNTTKYQSLRNRQRYHTTTSDHDKSRLQTQSGKKDNRLIFRKKTEKINNLVDISAIRVIYIQSLPKYKNEKNLKNQKERIKTECQQELKKVMEQPLHLSFISGQNFKNKRDISRKASIANHTLSITPFTQKKAMKIPLVPHIKSAFKRIVPQQETSSKQRPHTADISSNRVRAFEMKKDTAQVWEGKLKGWQNPQSDDFS